MDIFGNLCSAGFWICIFGVLVVEEVEVPGENHRPLVNFITCGYESSAPFL